MMMVSVLCSRIGEPEGGKPVFGKRKYYEMQTASKIVNLNEMQEEIVIFRDRNTLTSVVDGKYNK